MKILKQYKLNFLTKLEQRPTLLESIHINNLKNNTQLQAYYMGKVDRQQMMHDFTDYAKTVKSINKLLLLSTTNIKRPNLRFQKYNQVLPQWYIPLYKDIESIVPKYSVHTYMNTPFKKIKALEYRGELANFTKIEHEYRHDAYFIQFLASIAHSVKHHQPLELQVLKNLCKLHSELMHNQFPKNDFQIMHKIVCG